MGNECPKRTDFNSDFAAIDAAHPGTKTKAAPIAADSVLLYDSADAAKPKKTLFSALTTFSATTLADTFAALVHTQAAEDITSGVLPVVRGGTGSGDAGTVRKNLSAATIPISVPVTLPASGWVRNVTAPRRAMSRRRPCRGCWRRIPRRR